MEVSQRDFVGCGREVGRYLFQTLAIAIGVISSRAKSFILERCRRYRLWSLRGSITSKKRTNKLELLKWAREEKKCEWDYPGNGKVLRYK